MHGLLSRRDILAAALAGGVALVAPPLPARAYTRPEEHLPRRVRLTPPLPPGEIHVYPSAFALYWTLNEAGDAWRFAVGVARRHLYHPGTYHVGQKRKWPAWKPTPAMIRRDPKRYARFAKGMPGGPGNPLGARALYLYTPAGRDSALRIHGTPEPWTVGTAVSNGCVRLANEDIIQLYDMVPLGARVVLHPWSEPPPTEGR